jgi:PAS domain S-box-containing protein
VGPLPPRHDPRRCAAPLARPGTIAWNLDLIPTILGLVGLSAAAIGRARFRGVRADLRMAESRFRRLEGGPSIVYEWDFGTPGRWRYVSPQVERLLGYPVQDFVDDPDLWFRLIHDDDREAALASEERSQQDGVGERVEYRMHHRDGRLVWVRDEAIVVNDEGDRAFFRGILADITREKQAEREVEALNRDLERRVEERTAELHAANAELRAAKEQAVRASRLQSEFLSRASHELRTPLNAILGFGQLLQASPLEDFERDAVLHIVEGGHRLLELVDAVLDINAVHGGKLSLSIEPVSVDEVARETLEAARPAANDRSITLDTPEGPDGTFVLGDRQRLRQALSGIVTHAVRFNPEGGFVSIRWEASNADRTTIHVSDTSDGIDLDDVDRLFATFEPAGGAAPTRGPQLGLPLAKALVEAMGGSITVTSRRGEGSTVSVGLRSAEDPASGISPTLAGGSPDGVHTILYIEDNLANLELVQQILAHRPGTTLLRATLGEVGLQLARDHRPRPRAARPPSARHVGRGDAVTSPGRRLDEGSAGDRDVRRAARSARRGAELAGHLRIPAEADRCARVPGAGRPDLRRGRQRRRTRSASIELPGCRRRRRRRQDSNL